MSKPDLETFHETSRRLDFVGPMVSLLDEFHRGNIADKNRVREASAIQAHLGEHIEAWDRVFPRFPDCPWKRRTITWENHRGRRDVYLRHLIVTHVAPYDTGTRLIVNPATVIGRHARWLANELPDYEIVGFDIDPRWNRVYRLACFWEYRKLKNFRFLRENIFEPHLERRPSAVVFFGACGSVTDACMDYAMAVNSPFLICRSCCHDNIAGNTEIVRRRGRPINDFFAWKNWWIVKYKKERKGFYFCDRYLEDAYPRSKAARDIMDSDTIIAVARNSPESDICRSVIDLDRCLYLQENGYDVMYREELFFAHRRGGMPKPKAPA